MPLPRSIRLAFPLAVLLAGAGALTWLNGCTVGPDYTTPEISTPTTWRGAQDAASASRISGDAADLTKWWTALGDPALDDLVQRALMGNFDLAVAEARVRQSRAARTITASAGLPSVNASGSATRSRSPGFSGGDTSNLFRAGFDAGWEIDIFGGVRRGVEAADANIQSSVENVRDVRVTLLAEVASNYVELRAAQEQLDIARRNLAAQRQTLDLTRRRQAAGFVSKLDVANAETQVANTESRVPSIEINIRLSIYAIAILLGQEPGSLIDELTPRAPLATLPPAIPTGLPSEVLERRPDIRRSEADLHAATALVGVATADLYPRFSLSGAFGFQGGEISALGTLAQRFWSIGPAVQWPIFQGGAIKANIEQQKALVDGAVATYKSTILIALREVESSMIAYDREQQRTQSLDQSVTSSREAVRLATSLYQAGRTDFLNVLNAERSLLDAESSHLDSRRQTLTDLIALYKALGGGWDVHAPE